jgi:ABC-2 type transport system ATP-binding protein
MVVEARGPVEAIRAALLTIPGVERVSLADRHGEHAGFHIHGRGGQDLREAVSLKLVSNGWPIRRLDLRRSSLEERFVQAVTQDTLADAQPKAG